MGIKVKMSYSEDFGGTSNDDNDEIEDIEATNEQDNDYYSFLHVPRCATQDEIVAAYKKLSRLYHPDKHRDEEKKEYAGAMFTKLNQAYEVLRDPHTRALYDCLGKHGVAPDVLAVISRTKTPKEIRDEYERLAKEREERELLRRTNPTSRVVMRINATDLFERYMYDEYYDDVIQSSWPTMEVTEISFAQTIDAPLTVTEKLTLSGEVSNSNGRGNGAVSCFIKRSTSDSSSHEVYASIGNGPSLGGKYYRKLNSRTYLTMSGSMQLYSRGGITPGIQISLANTLSRRLKGYLTYSANYLIEETEDSIHLETQQSSMSTMLVYDGEKYYFMFSLQLGIPQTYLIMTMARKFVNPVGKLRASFKLGTFGAIIEYGIERKITRQSTIAATMAVGAVGVVLKIRLSRASQTYSFPIHLSDEILFQPIFYGSVTPVIAWYVLKKLILDPWEAKENKKAEKQHKMEENARFTAAKKDASHSVELMRERYQTICTNETAKNGLVVIVALYGSIFNDMQELLPEVNAVLESGKDNTEPLDNVDTKLLAVPEIVNVTIPIQCLVEEESRLILYEGSKSALAGFFDPCDEKNKYLVIQYLYRGQIHQAQIQDREQLRCPRIAHQLAK